MANLTDNRPKRTRGDLRRNSMPAPTSAATSLKIGSAVQENTGQLEYLTGAGSTFAGFLEEEATGNGAIDDKNRATYVEEGEILLLVDATGAGTIARADVGASVYATDGNTFTLDSTSAQLIGKVTEVPEGAHGQSAAELWVFIQGVQRRSL